jgi:hypothetical protein
MSYVRVSLLGTLLTEEVWSVNLTYDPTGEFETSVDQTALDAAAFAIASRTIPTSLKVAMSQQVSFTGARVEVRADADDHLIAISTSIRAAAVPGTPVLTLPPQSAIVLSLRTNTPGASGRGRIYWPALGASLSSTGRLAVPTTADFTGDMVTLLNGYKTDLTTAFPLIGFNLAVRSKTTKTTPHVVRVQTGNIIDVQRRRRDRIREAYVSQAI